MIVVAALAALAACGRDGGPAGSPAPDPGLDAGLVHTESGPVRGLVAPEHLLFQGIPYAAPPVGALRWKPPQPVRPWTELRDASRAGPRCIQDTARDPGSGRPDSEDCLSLNVWSPRGASARPVMVWIHGGSFVNGSADLYDARWLAAAGDIVVVTVNYRLGALGFLAHPALGTGNYGLLDQQAALRWVRDNIAKFGGDPAKVTIAGESAGAISVCDHLVAPGSAGLFRAAIIQSGPCQEQAGLPEARDVSLQYAAAVGCPDPDRAAECLRALPATALEDSPWYRQIGGDGLSGPVTGTPELPVDPVDALGTPEAARVPVLIGTNRDEFTLFAALKYIRAGREPSSAEYPTELQDTFGPEADAVGAQYPPARFGGSVPLAYSAAVTDGVFACVSDRMAEAMAAAPTVDKAGSADSAGTPVYAYEFNDPQAPAPAPLREMSFPVGASHSLELRYLFDVGGAGPLDPAQQDLSAEMIGYWTRFVSALDPNGDDAPQWQPFDNAPAGAWMSLQPDGSRMITSYAEDHSCGFWAGLE